MAKKLGIEVKILREKGERLNKKLEQAAENRYLKKPKTTIVPEHIKKLENSLLALKLFGGITKTDIPFEIPEDETRIDELELIFNNDHEGIEEPNYEKEAVELMKRYQKELDKQKIAELTSKLAELDEDDAKYEEIIKEISDLQKSQK